MKYSIIFILLLCYGSNRSFSQEKIGTEIYVKLSETHADDSITMFTFKTDIKEVIHLKGYSKDTLSLAIKHTAMPMFYKFFYPDLKVLFDESGNGKKEIEYSFDGKLLTIPLPFCSGDVYVEYEYQSESFFRSGFELISYLVPYVYTLNSWYFTCENMQVNEVKMSIPDELYFFANLPFQKDSEDNLVLSTKKIENNDITFYILQKDFYTPYTFKYKNVTVHLYQTSGAVLLPDSTEYVPDIPDKRLQTLRIKIVKDAIRKITHLLQIDRPLEITIVDKNITDNDKVGWGLTHCITENQSFVLIDSEMWNTSSIYHELLHAFDNKLFNKALKDSSSFFFNESLIEYFAIYLKYSDKKNRDYIYSRNMLGYARSKTSESSVLGLEYSNMDGNSNSGTAYIIYEKTPFVIYQFAKKVGEDRFIKVFRDFYKQVQIKDKITLKDFERVMKSHGVTDEEWDWFLWYL